MFFSNSLWFCLIFMPLIHFELLFVYGVRRLSHFILLLVDIRFSQHHLLKRLSFECPLNDLDTLNKNHVSIYARVIFGLPILFH